MDRKMDLDDVLSVAVKLRGLGYLLAQDKDARFPEDLPEIREGIGLLVLDLGRELTRIALAEEVTPPSSLPSASKRKAVRS
jgi:hypothetical protein